jgi:arylsulfatase A-like enzyme
MRAKTLLVSLLILVISGASHLTDAGKKWKHACPDCNVILISIDTLRADHLGCYGYPRETTPNLDEFSEQGVRFDRTIAHAPSTTASHASIFTSLIPPHHGAQRSKRQPISDKVRTMAEILREAGYRTVSYNGGGQVSAEYGFDRGFEVYEIERGGFSKTVGKAVRWMQHHPDEKFFMFLHTYEVHAPYQPNPAFMEIFDADYSGELDDQIPMRLLLEINDGTATIDEPGTQHIVNAYDAEIRSMDKAFGQLVRYLNTRELLEHTIVIFTSDHGEEFDEHAQIGRHSFALYDEILRVPLIIRLPGKKLASTVVVQPVRSIDILPTLIELLGLESSDQFEGSTLTALMRGRESADRVAVSQVDSRNDPSPISIRTGSEKLILGTRSFVEGAPYRWYEREVEFTGTPPGITLPIESLHRPRRLRISVDGEPIKEVLIRPRKQPLTVHVTAPESRITIEAVTPCTRPEDLELDLGLPCVSFRVFNPFELYRLADDPSEQRNLLDEAGHREDVSRLRRQLDEILASRETPHPEEVEIDPRTREQLKALGYID